MGPDPTPLSRPLPPLFKAEKGTLPFAAQPDGKIRVTYSSWDDAKIVHPGQVLELRWGRQGVECRIGDPKALEAILFEKPAMPFHCPSARGCKSDVDCTDKRCMPFFAGKTSTIAEPEQPRPQLPAIPDGPIDRAHLSKFLDVMAADLERSGAGFIQPFISKRHIEAFRALLVVDAIGLDGNGGLTGFSIGPDGKITQKLPEFTDDAGAGDRGSPPSAGS